MPSRTVPGGDIAPGCVAGATGSLPVVSLSVLEESQRFRFDGVPSFVVNGQVIEGAQPAKKFFDVIDAAPRQ